jgi:L-methionine (R)-S-oxide reductase
MSKELNLPDISQGREVVYKSLIPAIAELLKDETDAVAAMANTAAALKEAFGFFWVGFYRVCGQELVLAPFQGPVACSRIGRGRGVCGAAWERAEAVLVPDVELFPGHIACNSASLSEVVVPIINHGTVRAVLDVDSDKLDDFSSVDVVYLSEICNILSKTFL